MIVQFLDRVSDKGLEAELRVYEPSVTWRRKQIIELAEECGLFLTIRTVGVRDDIFHHWGCFRERES